VAVHRTKTVARRRKGTADDNAKLMSPHPFRLKPSADMDKIRPKCKGKVSGGGNACVANKAGIAP
ncbi:hypothetical protein K1Y00_28810, partial [Klebsiella pneumoniae subsp. pneumoniae]|nr:hypothetical protein [Klebsiella pneumoniae subsp. pneumoniae]